MAETDPVAPALRELENVVHVTNDHRIMAMMQSPDTNVARLGRLLHTGAGAAIASFIHNERERGTHPQMIAQSLCNLYGSGVGGIATLFDAEHIPGALRGMLDGIIEAAAIVIATERPDVTPPMRRPEARS